LLISSEVVHRIVAYAFLGEPPSAKQNIVDHIDTNRQNNRPGNLRWFTKLENILNNPITLKKIVFYCGSIEAFLENPAILKDYVSKEPKFEWMRSVTPEEAQTSWQRLKNWADREEDSPRSKTGQLGEWVFGNRSVPIPIHQNEEIVASNTPNAIQKRWITPSEFPLCPQGGTATSIEAYAANLKFGDVFAKNSHSDSIIETSAVSEDKSILWIVSRSSDSQAVKPWSLAKVTFENGVFVHQKLGSYFKRDGAEKEFTLARGLEWTGGDTFDDWV
jgi:hypothetical protein